MGRPPVSDELHDLPKACRRQQLATGPATAASSQTAGRQVRHSGPSVASGQGIVQPHELAGDSKVPWSRGLRGGQALRPREERRGRIGALTTAEVSGALFGPDSSPRLLRCSTNPSNRSSTSRSWSPETHGRLARRALRTHARAGRWVEGKDSQPVRQGTAHAVRPHSQRLAPARATYRACRTDAGHASEGVEIQVASIQSIRPSSRSIACRPRHRKDARAALLGTQGVGDVDGDRAEARRQQRRGRSAARRGWRRTLAARRRCPRGRAGLLGGTIPCPRDSSTLRSATRAGDTRKKTTWRAS